MSRQDQFIASFPVLPNQGNQCFSAEDNCMEMLDSDIHFPKYDIRVLKLRQIPRQLESLLSIAAA